MAETLITLAIIGVVAALTLPSLVEKYKQQVIITKLNKAYSIISQAYMSAKDNNGEIKDWNLKNYTESQSDEEDILYYLLPYLKVQKFCGKKEKGCFPDVRYGSIGSTGFGINLNSSNWYSKAVLADGSVVASITYSDFDGVIRIDVNGSNPPNILGIDLFSFYFNSNKIVPLGIYGVGAASPTNSFYINRGDYCTAWVIYGKTMDYIKDKKCEPYK